MSQSSNCPNIETNSTIKWYRNYIERLERRVDRLEEENEQLVAIVHGRTKPLVPAKNKKRHVHLKLVGGASCPD